MVLNDSGPSDFSERAAQVLTTNRKICAIHLDTDRNRIGTISHIPTGSQIFICGDGFNERTVKISWQNESYFAFREDVNVRTVAAKSGR
jgi:hypothetical protein